MDIKLETSIEKINSSFKDSYFSGFNNISEEATAINTALALKKSDILQPLLTDREIDIIKCLLYGKTAKETAKELLILPRTVERHLENIKLKFNCRNKSTLISKLLNVIIGNFIIGQEVEKI